MKSTVKQAKASIELKKAHKKSIICSSYGKKIYKTTKELQHKKIKAFISKNQSVFLEKLKVV